MQKTFILDGSNIIRSWLHIKRNINFKEESKYSSILIKALYPFSEKYNYNIEVYFDGPKRLLQGTKEIQVIFSHTKTSDDLIVNSVYDIVENYNRQVCVATMDKELINRCKAYGAEIINIWKFFNQIKQTIFQYT